MVTIENDINSSHIMLFKDINESKNSCPIRLVKSKLALPCLLFCDRVHRVHLYNVFEILDHLLYLESTFLDNKIIVKYICKTTPLPVASDAVQAAIPLFLVPFFRCYLQW